MSSRRWKILALIAMATIGIGFGVWLLRRGFVTLGCLWVGLYLWRARQFAVWFATPAKAPSDVAPPLTARWQRVLLSIIGLLGGAVCAVGVYLSYLWPDQWQAGLVFVLFGLAILAPITLKEIQSRRGRLTAR